MSMSQVEKEIAKTRKYWKILMTKSIFSENSAFFRHMAMEKTYSSLHPIMTKKAHNVRTKVSSQRCNELHNEAVK